MNKLFKILCGIVLISMFSIGSVNAQISGSAHDLTGTATFPGSWDGGTDACRFCHTPHNSNAVAPLWDRNASDTTGSFTVYASPTMDNAMPQPGGVSNGCLSCHDGVTAFDSLLGYTGTPGNTLNTTDFPGTTAIVGDDLSNDHPIGVTVSGTTEMNTVAAITGAGVRLFGADNVECASCHDVHKTTYTYFLRLDPDGADLCNACHTK
jgi:predicted CXXCH cytochrome family protein